MDGRTSKRAFFALLTADCRPRMLNGYAPEYVGATLTNFENPPEILEMPPKVLEILNESHNTEFTDGLHWIDI